MTWEGQVCAEHNNNTAPNISNITVQKEKHTTVQLIITTNHSYKKTFAEKQTESLSRGSNMLVCTRVDERDRQTHTHRQRILYVLCEGMRPSPCTRVGTCKSAKNTSNITQHIVQSTSCRLAITMTNLTT